MKNLKIVIVDDEKHSRELLEVLLSKYCTEIELLGNADTVESGISLINSKKPDLVFLDIEMRDGTGFDLLDKLKGAPFEVCFVTGYEQYAIKAIKHGCIDYLLKPVEINELKDAVQKTKTEIYASTKKSIKTILVNDGQKITVINTDEIISIMADNNYSMIKLNDRKILCTDNLSNLFVSLDKQIFFRTHKSYIVNLNMINNLLPGRTMTIEMRNGETIPVAARRKKEFLEIFNKY